MHTSKRKSMMSRGKLATEAPEIRSSSITPKPLSSRKHFDGKAPSACVDTRKIHDLSSGASRKADTFCGEKKIFIRFFSFDFEFVANTTWREKREKNREKRETKKEKV